MCALTPQRLLRLQTVAAARQRDFVVVLEDVHDPHNAAAILRSCDAFGVQEVHFVFDKVTPYDPAKVGKLSSSSANKWLDFRVHTSVTSCVTGLHEAGYTSVATALNPQAASLYQTDFATYSAVALMVGNEHAGLSEQAISLADHTMYIPMRGFVESLNVSVAAALAIAEISRQREASGKDWKIGEADQKKLLEHWSEGRSNLGEKV